MTKQINNLRLSPPNGQRSKYQVKSPDGRVLEEFTYEDFAVAYMHSVKYFTKKK